MQSIDPALWNADYSDPRVSHVAAIDPGFVWGLEKADVAALVPSTLLIGFGNEGRADVCNRFRQKRLVRTAG